MWPVKPDVADLALLPRPIEGFDHATAREVLRRLVVEDDLVDLPEVEIVGLQAPQRVFELPHRDLGVAPVRADLRHEEDLVATIDDRPAHALLAEPVVVVPGVVEEGDARADGGVHQAHGRLVRLRHAQVPAAQTDARHALSGAAERAHGNFERSRVHVRVASGHCIRSPARGPPRLRKSAIFQG